MRKIESTKWVKDIMYIEINNLMQCIFIMISVEFLYDDTNIQIAISEPLSFYLFLSPSDSLSLSLSHSHSFHLSLSPRLSHTFSLCMPIYLCLGICCFISPSLFYLLMKTFTLPFHSVPHPTSPGYISA